MKITRNDAKTFISGQIKDKDATAFEFISGSDEDVSKHFDDKFNSYSTSPTSGSVANNPNAKVIDNYDIINNNCVTTSVTGVQSGVTEDLKLTWPITPAALIETLQERSQRPNSIIKKIPYEEIKQELEILNGAGGSW